MRTRPFDREDPTILWVSSAAGEGREAGTFDDPFSTIEQALERVQAGYAIVLKSGAYDGDVTFQKSGTYDHPVLITSERGEGAIIREGCWYFYDICDLIVADLVFADAPHGAIAVIGKCERNSFAHLEFRNCGTEGKDSCTLYFGGSHAGCNLVENCGFERRSGNGHVSAAILIAEGDADAGIGEPNRDHIFRHNHFINYSYGILVGTRDTTRGEYGHIVECNTFESCSLDGTLIMCGDTTVRGNIFRHCRRSAITIAAGRGSQIEDNRIIDCATGIRTMGDAHTVQNNCIVRSAEQAIHVADRTNQERAPSRNIIVERNSCIDCGSGTPTARVAGIRIDRGTSCVLRQNLVYGAGRPYIIAGPDPKRPRLQPPQCFIDDNAASGGCGILPGMHDRAIDFVSYAGGDFTNNAPYGAQGWSAGTGPAAVASFSEWEMPAGEEEEPEEAAYADADESPNESGEESDEPRVRGLFYE